jgi:hypothetical protein
MRLALVRTSLLLSMLTLSACGQPSAAGPPAKVEVSPVTSPSVDPKAQPAVEAALRDAAPQAGVAPADLRVEQVQATEWRDASLGCPRAGAMYAQVLTPGFMIVISGGGKQFEYHADERGRVVLCSQS